RIVSPACAASIASCRLPPAGTVTVGPPPDGGGGGGGVGVEPLDTVTDFRLTPPLSNRSVITCGPAPSATGTLTFAQVCQPPVAGIATAADAPLGPSNATCIE